MYCTRSEVSLNVALHTTPDLRGSRVGFEPGFRGASGASGASEVLWVGHSIGTAFINLCQQVSWQRRATRIRGHLAPRRLQAASHATRPLARLLTSALPARSAPHVHVEYQRHGVEPLISGGRDTLVVRGFASAFRRAPAEGYWEQCLAETSTTTEPEHEVKDEV